MKLSVMKKKHLQESQIKLFKKIWDNRSHYSEISGEPLERYTDELWLCIFAHILPKSHYPRYKYSEENIMLVTPSEHQLLDQGTYDQRAKYPKVNWDLFFQKKEHLKRQYYEEERQFI